jgi:hypothetical protein
MKSRFSSFSLTVLLSLASSAPVLAAETNRSTHAAQLLSNPETLRTFARRESGFDDRVFVPAIFSSNPGAYSASHPYNDFLNGGKPTPAAALLSNPKALLAESRRASGLDDHRGASIGYNRSAFAAVSTDVKQRLAARNDYVVMPSVKKPPDQTGIRSVEHQSDGSLGKYHCRGDSKTVSFGSTPNGSPA